MKTRVNYCITGLLAALLAWGTQADAQLIDRTKAPNTANEGIAKSLTQQIGAGRGDLVTPDSSAYIIARDPFRSVRRGRQLFQRKFTAAEGQGPVAGDGFGNINTNLAIGAGLADSCAACHGRPRGSAGFGGAVATRPDSRDAPHLFGLGLKEMIGDEITADLRAVRAAALTAAQTSNAAASKPLVSKGINYGTITARPDGTFDTSQVKGVDPDLRVRPFFAHGAKFSMREFIVGALNDEMGLQSVDPDLATAMAGGRVTTPSGLVLDGALDRIDAPLAPNATADPDGDGVANEIPQSLVDHLEFYLLNYFKPGVARQTITSQAGRVLFNAARCNSCHVPDLVINRDRRVADVETEYDAAKGGFNRLFATAKPLFNATQDNPALPALKQPKLGAFVVKNIFSDFKRHDLGPNFHERNYDGTVRTEFMTTPLWGVGSTAPYGHDGRSINLLEVTLRHGGEAQSSRDTFARMSDFEKAFIIEFLNTLVIFPPDDTSSNLNPGDPTTPGYPQRGHGSIRLPVLFNDPTDPE